MSQNAPAPARLMLILPADLDPAEAEARVAAGDVAAVILTPGATLPSVQGLKALAAPLQRHDCAVLLAGPVELAQKAKLDGVHMEDPTQLAEALKRLKPEGIVGAGGIASRHDAMVAGESGADYVLFGTLDGDPVEPVAALASWWSEVFEVPCVAVAPSQEAVAALIEAGADFIALAPPLLAAADAPAQVRAAQARLEAGPTAPQDASGA